MTVVPSVKSGCHGPGSRALQPALLIIGPRKIHDGAVAAHGRHGRGTTPQPRLTRSAAPCIRRSRITSFTPPGSVTLTVMPPKWLFVVDTGPLSDGGDFV